MGYVLIALAWVAMSGCAALHASPRDDATSMPPGPPKSEPARSQSPPSESVETIEETRRSVRSTAEWLARGVDGWFGDKPFEAGGSVTNGVLRLSVLKRQTEKFDVDLRFKARFRLPNVEEKTYLFLGRDDRQSSIIDRPGTLSEAQRSGAGPTESPAFFAGLGRQFDELFDLRLGFRGIKPYAQARAQKEWQVGPRSYVDARETLFWTPSDRFGSTTALSWEWDYGPAIAVRWVSAATITQDEPEFKWSSVLGGYRSFGGRRLLALETLTSGRQKLRSGPTDYGAQARWIQPVYKHWLLGEVLIGRFWLRNDPSMPRRPVWALGTTMTMEF